MTDWGRFLCTALLVVCLTAGHGQQVYCAEYSPVTVEKAADIVKMIALIDNYTKALKNYTNNGDREIFSYVKHAESGSDQVVPQAGNDPISFIHAVVSAIKFSDTGEKAYISVFGNVAKKPAGNAEMRSEYYWMYEAEKVGSNWVLSKCGTHAGIPDRASQGSPRSIFINSSEYMIGEWVFFSNPKDEGKLYRAHVSGNDSKKILDESVSIVDLAFSKAILYVSKSRNNEIGMLDSRSFGTKKTVPEFADTDGSYFTDGFSIFRTGDNGAFQRIFSRVPYNRSRLRMTELKDKWIYFFYFGEDEKMFYRVRTDGSAVEFLPDARADWRDEEY